jgi:hypothetical protein
MTGLINTSGILTNAVPGTLPSNTTYVDYFLDSINLLRIGPALAEADQCGFIRRPGRAWSKSKTD